MHEKIVVEVILSLLQDQDFDELDEKYSIL